MLASARLWHSGVVDLDNTYRPTALLSMARGALGSSAEPTRMRAASPHPQFSPISPGFTPQAAATAARASLSPRPINETSRPSGTRCSRLGSGCSLAWAAASPHQPGRHRRRTSAPMPAAKLSFTRHLSPMVAGAPTSDLPQTMW
eukprot:scaffold22208_cov65-Phaeocystis_antarctica.AAC.3